MQAIIEPQAFVHELKNAKLLNDFVVPQSVVLYLPPGPVPKTSVQMEAHAHNVLKSRLCKVAGHDVGIATNLGIGAPSLVIFLEILIALGVKRFVAVGTAGAIDKSLNINDLVICEKAWRGEGTSVSYSADKDWSIASNKLFDHAQQSFNKNNFTYKAVSSWTTDAYFRETRKEVDHMRQRGASVVEMECSALYTVAQFRHVAALSLFVISDQLSGEVWEPQFRGFKPGLSSLLSVAIETLSG